MFNLSENLQLENLDNVPDKYKGLYAQDDEGRFVISDTAKGIVDDYVGMTKALDGAKKTNKATNDENARRRQSEKAFKDLASDLGIEAEDLVEGFRGHIKDLAEKIASGKEVNVNLDKIKADADKRVRSVSDEKDAEIGKMTKSLERYMVDQAATAAAASHKGKIKLLMPHVKGHCKVVKDGDDYSVRVVDDQGDIRTNNAGDPMTVQDLVEEMKNDSDFAACFESEAKGGTGSKPGSTNGNKGTGGNLASKQQRKAKDDMTSREKIAAGLRNKQFTRESSKA